MGAQHIPVMPREVVECIGCRDNGIYVDATLGSGGHALNLLQACPGIRMLIGLDCDEEAIGRAQKTLEPFSRKVRIIHANFRTLKKTLEGIGITRIDAILFDLGVSTPQLKDPARGFSFNLEGALDMRMDRSNPRQAKDLIAGMSAGDLSDILFRYGQERWAKKIAGHIRRQFDQKPVETTKELADIVLQAIPRRFYPEKIHPATRTFQALRIAVNDELGAVEQGLDAAIDMLNPGGRLCAISFHSLEDNIIKHRFKAWEKGCTCPPRMPVCACGQPKKLRIITRKPVSPSGQEAEQNPSARSAKLRAGERI